MGESRLNLDTNNELTEAHYLYENYLTKSEYKRYQLCQASFWEDFRNPQGEDLDVVAQANIAQGHAVEKLAFTLFDALVEVPKADVKTATALTQAFMVEENAIAQATIVSPQGFVARADVMAWNEALAGWDLYEVKAVTALTPEHYEDLAFQHYVFEQAGLKIARVFVIYLNYAYRRGATLDAKKLLKTRNITNEAQYQASRRKVELTARRARKVKRHALVTTEARPAQIVCKCWGKPAQDRCGQFYNIHPSIPKFSSFDVRLKGRKKEDFYEQLFANDVYSIEDIPAELAEKTGSKQAFIELYKAKATTVDIRMIAEELASLSYPLYFLDYETAKNAIPYWENTGPYQQIVFQYSLHVLTGPPDDEASQLLHYEYLATDASDPTGIIAEKLMSQIGPVGSVIVWNKSFEQSRNREIGERYPSSQEFFEDVNDRIYDLMNIFRKNYYQDWRFKGSASIKNVLPVISPDVSYDDLQVVANGGDAMTLWPRVIFEPEFKKDRDKVFKALLAYCGLDTYAMVKIYQHLFNMLASES